MTVYNKNVCRKKECVLIAAAGFGEIHTNSAFLLGNKDTSFLELQTWPVRLSHPTLLLPMSFRWVPLSTVLMKATCHQWPHVEPFDLLSKNVGVHGGWPLVVREFLCLHSSHHQGVKGFYLFFHNAKLGGKDTNSSGCRPSPFLATEWCTRDVEIGSSSCMFIYFLITV